MTMPKGVTVILHNIEDDIIMFDRKRTYTVLLALQEGATWGDIGKTYGISRQAARERFVKRIEAFKERNPE